MPTPPKVRAAGSKHPPTFVALAGGPFIMGTNDFASVVGDGEGPPRTVRLKPFLIDAFAVTNRQFKAFVDATAYQTEAERYGWSFVFYLQLPDDAPPTRAVADAPWWRQVIGADWRHPTGPWSQVGNDDHPVVHVSWNDARAYCQWAKVRLPSEAEWEYAARGGLVQRRYAWGDDLAPGGRQMCNIFQGPFPYVTGSADSQVGTMPVDAYAANGFGLHNVAGNVWEWCEDWFGVTHGLSRTNVDLAGPVAWAKRVIRGGSYLSHDSYCNRYRVSARSSNSPDSSTGHLGFRVAADSANP